MESCDFRCSCRGSRFCFHSRSSGSGSLHRPISTLSPGQLDTPAKAIRSRIRSTSTSTKTSQSLRPLLTFLTLLEPVMHFGTHLERAPTVRRQANPGQARQERRPGSCVNQGPSPQRAIHVVTPLQGLVRDGRFSQGVALGWHVAGPLALKASSFAKCMTVSNPLNAPTLQRFIPSSPHLSGQN